MPPTTPAPEVFALDIGTRTIVGLILSETPKGFHIRAAEVFEHASRAMYDGQVHDVAAVAAGVRQVKTALERRLRRPLTQAAVAAAGRALKTARGEAHREKSAAQEVTPADVRALELEALRAAQESLARAEGQSAAAGYFCVGYSVTEYILEGAPISELTGQFGQEIGLSVIATFLPRVVVDSLFAVLRRAGLEAASLTLEPIAAAEVSIPPGMRQLNLALVDIGAGTSDIALVRRGNICAYAMVPVAGDEITDALCQRFLLDFSAGEQVKRQLGSSERVTFTDILGQKQELSTAALVQELVPAIDSLADRIATEILTLNGRPPDAVLLVGGGSLTPTLPAALARALELPENRVGLRGREAIAAVTGQAKKLAGPQAVTPIGIAVTALHGSPLHFLRASVNGQSVYLWNLAGQTVAQALLAAGASWNRLFGRPGLALTVEVNGDLRVIPGGQGGPATIRVNGAPADLDTPLTEGAQVDFTPGADGRNAQATVGDLVGAVRRYRLNGVETPFPPRLTVNGRPADPATPVPDRAQVEIHWERPVRELLSAAGVPPEKLVEEDIPFSLGSQRCTLPFAACRLVLNGRAAQPDDPVRPGDALDYTLAETGPSVASALAGRIAPAPPLRVKVNGQLLSLPGSGTTILVNGRPARLDDPLPRGASISLVPGRSSAILSDLFALVDVKKNAPPGGHLVMSVNGEPADFTTPLKDGDAVELRWD